MKLLKGDSFPIFLVSDGVSQQSCRGHLSKEVARSSGCRRSVQRFRCSMAVFELLARATGAWVVISRFESSRPSQAVRRSEKRSLILAERPANGGLLRISHRSLGSDFEHSHREIADSLRRTFEKLPFLGDCGRRPGSICTAWPGHQCYFFRGRPCLHWLDGRAVHRKFERLRRNCG
jgi:hypothetical protein